MSGASLFPKAPRAGNRPSLLPAKPRPATLAALARRADRLEEATRGLGGDGLAARLHALAKNAPGGPSDLPAAAVAEVLALCREAVRRALGVRLHEGQLMGAVALHLGCIAEMATGEGKTLAALPAACLQALCGRPVHVMTANDYLARRDAAALAPAYALLGLRCAALAGAGEARRRIYACDVVYGTCAGFAFDWLQDNLRAPGTPRLQRDPGLALVDEADALLVDEAAMPFIITVPAPGDGGASREREAGRWKAALALLRSLGEEAARTAARAPGGEPFGQGLWEVDRRLRTVALTEKGARLVEERTGCGGLFRPENLALQHRLQQGLRALTLLRRGVDYVVEEGRIVLLDPLTGRELPGRRWSMGLQQAVEAKEGLAVTPADRVVARIGVHGYLGRYARLAGMTATARQAAGELSATWGLPVAVIPPHRPSARRDLDDLVFLTQREKFAAVAACVRREHARGRPVLVGVADAAVGRALCARLARGGLAPVLLAAGEHAEEARIVAAAGRHGSITVATGLAGRGTDIRLDEKARAAGGLAVIGTCLGASGRADAQLAGRAGRQGDPGSARFLVSLDEPLPRRFGGTALAGLCRELGQRPGHPLRSPAARRLLREARATAEELRADERRHLLALEAVPDAQRAVFYARREAILEGRGLEAALDEALAALRPQAAAGLAPLLAQAIARDRDGIRRLYLRRLDAGWARHLARLEALADGMGLRALAGLDPLREYGREGHALFLAFLRDAGRDALAGIVRTARGVGSRRGKTPAPCGSTTCPRTGQAPRKAARSA